MHSEGILTGELKHGPIALIDPDMKVLMVCTRDKLYAKTMSGVQQVNARKVSTVRPLRASCVLGPGRYRMAEWVWPLYPTKTKSTKNLWHSTKYKFSAITRCTCLSYIIIQVVPYTVHNTAGM